MGWNTPIIKNVHTPMTNPVKLLSLINSIT